MERYFCDGDNCDKELGGEPKVVMVNTSRGVVGKHRTTWFNVNVILSELDGGAPQLCKDCRNKVLGFAFDDLMSNLKCSRDNTK